MIIPKNIDLKFVSENIEEIRKFLNSKDLYFYVKPCPNVPVDFIPIINQIVREENDNDEIVEYFDCFGQWIDDSEDFGQDLAFFETYEDARFKAIEYLLSLTR